MSCTKKSCTRRSDDGMDDDSDDKDSKRKSRNLSEKKRRDQFNLLVNELNTMVSTAGGRKMDKSTILKATISFLKNHNEVAIRSQVHEIQENWKPNFLTNEEFTHLILEAVDGFLVVLGNTGNILYISESITSLLGYNPDDILGMTIYDLGCAEEQNELYHILTSPETEEERPVSFSCHIRKTNYDQRQRPIYDLVHFMGYFRVDTETDSSRYSSYCKEADSRLVFIGTGRLQVPHLINEMRLLDSTIKTEFTSRHSLEWKFLYLDHRAPPIIGYLPFELLGTSGYDYYHIDDMDRVVGCHDVLMQKGEGTSCYYRFLTKGQQWIWLQTRFYITYHQWNSKPDFIVCTHRVVSHVDVMRNAITDPFSRDPSPTSDVASPGPWYSRSTRGGNQHQSSDCISIMSADSPMSRHSCVTQLSTKSKNSLDGEQSSNSSNNDQSAEPSKQPSTTVSAAATFIEQTQYVASVATALPTFYDLNNQGPTQMQVDLQRKHAELQAIIGQQQAELRRVSEQLLMARLGILQTPQTTTINNTAVSSYNTGTVSSTTNVLNPVSVSGLINQPRTSTADATQSNVI